MEQESEIIRRIQNQDRNAYAILVDKYKGPIFNLAFCMTHDYNEAEDLAQETFYKAFKGLTRFDHNKRFFPWLYTIALNLIRNHLKKTKPNFGEDIESKEQGIWHGNYNNVEQVVIEKREIDELNFSLKKVAIPMREAIILRYYQGLSFEDMAEILGISVSNAKMRVYRGLERLRILMESERSDNRV